MIKVLIIDDDKHCVEVLKAYLSREKDFEIIATAKDGKDGIEKLNQNPSCNVVILDITMPVYDGFYFLERIEQLKNKPFVVVTSSINSPKATTLACNMGATFFIVKPFDIEHLVYTIRRFVNMQLSQKQSEISLLELFDVRRRGTVLIKKAIELVQNDPNLIINMNLVFEILTHIYVDLSLRKVKWNVDKTIERTWKAHKKEIAKIMNIQDGLKPNLRAIIDYCISKNM